jgi:hypothetical protein
MPSFEDFKKALQRRPIPSAWSGELPPLEEMVPWADPVKRGVASPEMMAEQGQRDELMQNAEFRPANRREKTFIRQLNKLNESPEEKQAAIRRAILKKYGSDDFTPQVASEVPPFMPSFLYNDPQKGQRVWGDINRIIKEDVTGLGYEGQQMTRHTDVDDWRKINEAFTKKKPKHLYHVTDQENLDALSREGITPPKSRGKNPNVEQYQEQADKVFLTDNPNSLANWAGESEDMFRAGIKKESMREIIGKEPTRGTRFTYDGQDYVITNVIGDTVTAGTPKANLRTRTPKTVKPDVYQEEYDRGEAWYQTKNPIPANALDIEAAPGVWEPLIEYMKKRGGK